MLTEARAVRVVSRARLDFEPVEDPRAQKGQRHGHAGLLRLIVAGMAAGRNDLRGIEALSQDLSPELRRRLGLRRGVSDTCLYELLSNQEVKGFREVLFASVRRDLDAKAIQNDLLGGGVLAIDGKGAGGGLGEAPDEECRESICDAQRTSCWDLFALRASLVSSSAKPLLDQEFLAHKGNEVKCFPQILERVAKQFPRLFNYVTVDAGMTCATNAEAVITLGKKYVMAVKANRKRLYDVTVRSLTDAPVVDSTSERASGEIVQRELRRVAAPAETCFPEAQQLWSVRQQRVRNDGSVSLLEERFFVSNAEWDDLSQSQILQIVRLHWGIENGPNWAADMVFDEDTRCPCTPAVSTLSWLRIFAYNLLSVFRAHLPLKDKRPQSWSRAIELIYQALIRLWAAPLSPTEA